MHFWTEATQHVELECFGYFDGYAMFRADRAQLGQEYLEVLAKLKGFPDPNPSIQSDGDLINCRATTIDSEGQQRRFFADVLGYAPLPSEGAAGESGNSDENPVSVLGCEFHQSDGDPTDHPRVEPYSANPFCIRDVTTWGESSSVGLRLSHAERPYHVELVDCDRALPLDMTVELFAPDSNTPIAVGVAPREPGTNHACLELDAQVAELGVGRLVFRSPSGKLGAQQLTFR